MAGHIAQAFVQVRPDTTGFKAEAERGVKTGLGGIGKIIGGAFAVAGLEEAVRHVAEAAASQQEELSVVRQAIKSTSSAWVVHGKTITETLRDSAVKFGFTVSDLAQGFTRIQVSTKDSSKTLGLLTEAMDIARARHLGLAQAAVVVAKAQAGNVTGLQRLGIVIPKVSENYDRLKRRVDEARASGAKFTKTQELEIKGAYDHAKALDVQSTKQRVNAEILGRFGGQAQNFAKTAEGSGERFREAVNELEVAVGNGLLPTLTEASVGATRLFKDLADGGQVQAIAAGTARELASAYGVVKSIMQTLAPPITAVAKAVGEVAHAAGGGGIVAFAIGFKTVSAAIAIDASIRAKWASVVKAGGEASATAAAAEKTESVALAELTAALVANTEALAANGTAAGAAAAERTLLIASSAGVIAEERVITAGLVSQGVALESTAAKTGRLATASRGLFALAGGWSTVVAVGLGAAAFGIYKLITAEDDLDAANKRVISSTEALDRATQIAADTRKRLAALTALIPQDKLSVARARLDEQSAKGALLTTHAGKNSEEFQRLQINLIQAIQERRRAEKQLADDQEARVKTSAASEFADKRQTTHQRERAAAIIALAAKEEEVALRRARADTLRARQTQDSPQGIARDAKARIDAARKFADQLDKDAQSEKNKTLRRNEELIAAFARKTGRKPSDQTIRFLIDNKDPKAKLADLVRNVRQTDRTAALAAHAAGEHIGKQLGLGVADGSKSIHDTIVAAGAAAVRAFQEGAKKAGKIKSPSRLTHDEIGVPLAEGIAAGVRSLDLDEVVLSRLQLGKSREALRTKIRDLVRAVPAGVRARGDVRVDDGRAFVRKAGRDERIPNRPNIDRFLEGQVGRGLSRAGANEVREFWTQHGREFIAIGKARAAEEQAVMRRLGSSVGKSYVDGVARGAAGVGGKIGGSLASLLGGARAEARKSAASELGAPVGKGIAEGIRASGGEVARALAEIRKLFAQARPRGSAAKDPELDDLRQRLARIRDEFAAVRSARQARAAAPARIVPQAAAPKPVRAPEPRIVPQVVAKAPTAPRTRIVPQIVTKPARTPEPRIVPQVVVAKTPTAPAPRIVPQVVRPAATPARIPEIVAKAPKPPTSPERRIVAQVVVRPPAAPVKIVPQVVTKAPPAEPTRIPQVAKPRTAPPETRIVPQVVTAKTPPPRIVPLVVRPQVTPEPRIVPQVVARPPARTPAAAPIPRERAPERPAILGTATQAVEAKIAALRRLVAELHRASRGLSLSFDATPKTADYATRLRLEQLRIYADAARQARASGTDVGRAYVHGVASGVGDRAGARAAVANLLERAVGAESPARLGAEKIGAPTGKGIADGIRSRAADVTRAIAELRRLLDEPKRTSPGLVAPESIDLLRRKVGQLRDSGIATAKNVAAGDKGEARLARVLEGKIAELRRAHAEFEVAGKHLGNFDSGRTDAFAERLHREEAAVYASSVRQAKAGGRSTGRAYSEGVAAGIADLAKDGFDAVERLLAQTIAHGKESIGARSPSTVARLGIGHALSEGIALGILDKNGDVIKALTTQVQDAVEAGVQAVRDAVNSAKQNLNSLGSSLSGDISTLLAKRGEPKTGAPTGAQAVRLKELLKRIQAGTADTETVKLAQALSNQAVAKQSIAQQAGGTDKGEAIQRKIADLLEHLNRGDIRTEKVFDARLNSILRSAGVSGKAGDKSLGIAFGDQLRADIRGIREQARAILGAPKVKGTGLEPTIVRPLEVIREQQRSIADAAANQRAAQLAEEKQHTAELKKANKHLADVAAHTKGTATVTDIRRIIRNAEKQPQASLDALIAASNRHGR